MAEQMKDEQLMRSLLGKLYQVVTGGDDKVQADTRNFVVWCAPGIPFSPEALAFAQGLNGSSGEEARSRLAQAADFARIVNTVPDPTGVWNRSSQETVLMGQGDQLWNVYRDALKLSQVAANPLTEPERKKIEKFRGLLTKTEKYVDLVTDAEKERVVDSPLVAAYKQGEKKYDDHVMEYNSRRLAALNSETAAAVQDWALNAATYRRRVQSAMDEWTGQGYKNDYEQIQAYLAQVTERDMSLRKRQLQDDFERGKMTDINTGGDFYFSAPAPGTFAASNEGWTEFSFGSESQAKYESYKYNSQSTSGSAGRSFGWLFRSSMAASYSREEEKSQRSFDMTGFKMSFKLTQVPIIRPWFSGEFLTSRAWKWQAGLGNAPLSDGGAPPTGRLTAWPVTCLFIRDLLIDFKELHESASSFRQSMQSSVSGSVGLFGLNLGGASSSFSFKDSARSERSSLTTQGLKVPGMQLIGLKCSLMPRSPNPSPDIQKWQ